MLRWDDAATIQATVIGAGTMGRGCALALAIGGSSVRLFDVDPERGEQAIAAIAPALEARLKAGLIDARQAVRIARRISLADSLDDAISDAELVIEAVTEIPSVKQQLLADIGGKLRSSAIVATNTSTIDIDVIAAAYAWPERVLGAHWFHPAHIIPCVEVVPATTTEASVLSSIVTFLTAIGKAPVIVKNVAGFVANRIQVAMAAEAFRCLEEGLASAEDIDQIVRRSFGLRLAAYGPFAIRDQAGLDNGELVLDYLYAATGRDIFRAPELLLRLVREGRLGLKAGAGVFEYDGDVETVWRERDERLYRLLQATAIWEA
jgi:3-hydroxybutyryl-CoA dehydrogenase